jgi:hypothetical protein
MMVMVMTMILGLEWFLEAQHPHCSSRGLASASLWFGSSLPMNLHSKRWISCVVVKARDRDQHPLQPHDGEEKKMRT